MPGAFSPMIDGVTARPTEYGLVRKSRAGKCARMLTGSRHHPAFWRMRLHQPRVATNPHSGESATSTQSRNQPAFWRICYINPESQPTRILANAPTPNQSRNQPAFSRMRLHQTRVATNPHSRECGYTKPESQPTRILANAATDARLGHRISVTARHPTETKEHEA